jgi:diaminopimelate epimerase
MERIRFTKMHASGNDYIYINAQEHHIADPESFARTWSDRHKGIGADGLVLIGSSDCADFSMRIFNADGSEGLMCGNACRCIGKYVYDKGMTDKTLMTLETKAGIKEVKLDIRNGKTNLVTVDMGIPTFSNKRQVNTNDGTLTNEIFNLKGTSVQGTFVCMGNPHVVFFVDNLDSLPHETLGYQIEHNPLFPERINVEFAEIISEDTIKVKVWERGSGITQSCGTGACAVAAAASLSGIAKKNATIYMDGGNIDISWNDANSHIYLSGDAHYAFEGWIE